MIEKREKMKLTTSNLINNTYNFQLINSSDIDEIMGGDDFEREEFYKIEQFDFSNCEVKLVKKESGECYEGLVIKDSSTYYIDIENEEIVNLFL